MAGRHVKKTPKALKDEKLRRKRRTVIAVSVLAVCLALGGGGYYALTRPLTHTEAAQYKGKTLPPVETTAPDDERTNILLIGTDSRVGAAGGNTDVLILCSIDRKHQRIELLSIPRDTKVMFPDGTYSKINEGLMLGGPALTESLVNGLIHQPIDHYALTHFGGLVDIIDTIGGVTINVDKRMYYNTGDKQYGVINLQPGVQNLSGEQALGYVRFRHDTLGDIGRTERQQEFLAALAKQLLQPANVTKLPTLVREFWDTIDTDMSMLEVLGIAGKAKQFEGYQIIHETLPGSFHDPDKNTPNDQSYWIVNPQEAQYVAEQFFDKGVVVRNPIQDPSVTENWTPPVANSGSADNTSTTRVGNSTSDTDQPSTGADRNTLTTEQMVATGNAYIRSGPGQQYSVIASMVKGQVVTVVGKSGDWYEIQLGDGNVGYTADWLLSAIHN
jgi:polyisoprenyl-teichoic acid--peptidoglycan teichoic acid transferase